MIKTGPVIVILQMVNQWYCIDYCFYLHYIIKINPVSLEQKSFLRSWYKTTTDLIVSLCCFHVLCVLCLSWSHVRHPHSVIHLLLKVFHGSSQAFCVRPPATGRSCFLGISTLWAAAHWHFQELHTGNITLQTGWRTRSHLPGGAKAGDQWDPQRTFRTSF